MTETALDKRMARVIALKLKVLKRFHDEYVAPLERFGSPEKLLGKPYELWTPQDIQMLGQVYGSGNDTPLARLIAKKEWEKTKAGEAELKALIGGR